jgi:anti-sigma-K factor RskA
MNEEARESHQTWDELVAAHALHALEQDEELRLLGHIDGCPSCQSRLDEFTLVAAQLGSLGDEEVQPPDWTTIRSRLVTPPVAHITDAAARHAAAVPLRRRVATRILAAAAGILVVVGLGAAFGWQLTRPAHKPTMSAALTACRQQSGCKVIQLHGETGDGAAVLVEAGHASLVPITMPPAPSGRMYVLWQLPRDGSPIPVVTFRDAKRQSASVPLVTGYSDTAAFAVSLEDAGPMPTRPTDVLAAGAATS